MRNINILWIMLFNVMFGLFCMSIANREVSRVKTAFIDRDGTIVEDVPDCDWAKVTEPVFLPGAINALRAIGKKGYRIIIVTNQYLIGEGIITGLQYEDFTQVMLRRLRTYAIDIMDVLFCPHARWERCVCAKPKTGLIDQALAKYPDIELDQSFVAGDSECDAKLGQKFRMRTFWINAARAEKGVVCVPSLFGILSYI
jgi:D-glycero-D-manno-heptose 1,7-bisphosphate phosphatase